MLSQGQARIGNILMKFWLAANQLEILDVVVIVDESQQQLTIN